MKTSLLTAALISIGLTGCISTTNIGMPVAEKKQMMLVSSDYAIQFSQKSFKEMSGAEQKVQYMPYEQHLVEIMNKMIPSANAYLKDGREVEWGLHVNHDDQFNAGAFQHGIVMINSALAQNKEMTETDFAFVIGHEMAHILREHGRIGLGWRHVARPIMVASVLATGGATLYPTWVAHDVFYTLSSKRIEMEADLIALDLMAKSGYNPRLAGHMLDVAEPIMKKNHPVVSRIPSIFKTHPSFKTRQEAIEKNAPRFMDHYEKGDFMATDVDTRNLIQFNARTPVSVSQLTHELDGVFMTKADYKVKMAAKEKMQMD